MKTHFHFLISLLAVLCLGVQASSKVTDQEEIVTEKVPRRATYGYTILPPPLPTCHPTRTLPAM